MISGNISSTSYTVERASLLSPINTAPVLLDGDDAVWPCGLILGKKADGSYVPYGEVTEAMGVGDGTEKDFATQLGPIEPGSVTVEAGAVAMTDDGCGNLVSTGGSGVINYEFGKVAVSFTAAPANAADIGITYKPDPWAVLDQETDTDDADSALAVKFGAVKKTLLKVGVASPAAPSAAVITRLELRHIHPV